MVLVTHCSKKFIQAFVAFYLVTPVFAGVLPFFNPTYVSCQGDAFYVNTNIFLTNDPFTLKDLLNGLKTNSPHIKNGKNIALASARVDLGYNKKGYGYFGYTYREEILIDTNQETIKLLYLATNKKDIPIGKHYNLDLSIKAFKVQGIEYAKNFNLYNHKGYICNIGFALEGLQGKDMQDGRVNGKGVVNLDNDYSFKIVSHYDYTHNYLYKLDVQKAFSYGYSSHLSFYLKTANLSLLLLGNDILGKLYWKNLPHSDIRLFSHNKVYNAKGYIKYKPSLSLYEGYKNYTQTLIPKYRLQLAYKHKRYFFKLGSDVMYGIYMPYIESAYKVVNDFSLGIGYEIRFHSVTFNSKYKNFVFNVKTDSIFKPSTLGLNISYLF